MKNDECIVLRNAPLINPMIEYQVRVPAYPKECEYIRIIKVDCDGKGEEEVVYWDRKEWQEDPDLNCIGAIMGAMAQITQGITLDIDEQ